MKQKQGERVVLSDLSTGISRRRLKNFLSNTQYNPIFNLRKADPWYFWNVTMKNESYSALAIYRPH